MCHRNLRRSPEMESHHHRPSQRRQRRAWRQLPEGCRIYGGAPCAGALAARASVSMCWRYQASEGAVSRAHGYTRNVEGALT